MKITTIYDNEIWKECLESDWGFFCLIEIGRTQKVLFETGADGRVLLSNIEVLYFKPFSINEVFISHNQHDLIGDLVAG